MISLLITLAIIGFIVYLIVTYIPMPEPFKQVIIVIVVICLLAYVLRVLGFVDIPLRTVK
jgi:hypothetical protein